jgi:hypothetical protein
LHKEYKEAIRGRKRRKRLQERKQRKIANSSKNPIPNKRKIKKDTRSRKPNTPETESNQT